MTDYNYLQFQAQVTALSPLHIGTGRELLLDYDYAVHGKQTWRLNEDQVLQPHYSDDQQQIALLAQTAPAKILADEDYKADRPFFRYVIHGVPRARASGSVLREQIKSIKDEPYLPGSSLKGALRTVIATYGWQALKLKPDLVKLNSNPKFAARNYEMDVFGADPNHDLLRALQVSDSAPLKPDCLMLANVKVLKKAQAESTAADRRPRREEGAPIEVEAIKPDTQFDLAIKIDLQLFSDWAQQRGNFRPGGRREWLEQLAALARGHANDRIKRQYEWYSQQGHAEKIANFYRDLGQLKLRPNQFVIQVGWGAGWDSKTFGAPLLAEPKFLEAIITKYRMAKGKRNSGDSFPKSRRSVLIARRDSQDRLIEEPVAPLGWVLMEMTERTENA